MIEPLGRAWPLEIWVLGIRVNVWKCLCFTGLGKWVQSARGRTGSDRRVMAPVNVQTQIKRAVSMCCSVQPIKENRVSIWAVSHLPPAERVNGCVTNHWPTKVCSAWTNTSSPSLWQVAVGSGGCTEWWYHGCNLWYTAHTTSEMLIFLKQWAQSKVLINHAHQQRFFRKSTV